MTQTGSSKLFGNPTNIPFLQVSVDQTQFSPGGRVTVEVAAGTLLNGDIVFRNLGGRMEKTLESSPYFCLDYGVVVGGQTSTGNAGSTDSSLVGTTAATVGQSVIVQRSGICYVSVDSTAIIRIGHSIYPGQTTAGRVLGGVSGGSYANNAAGMVIKAGASALTKSALAMLTTISGGPGTTTAAALDGAAFSGTTANAAFAQYVFRVATNGSTTSSAKSADAASLAALLWPTAGAASVATYGVVVINPTGTGGFVGGTTALDDATVVPGAVYYDLFSKRKSLGIALAASDGTAGHALLVELAPA